MINIRDAAEADLPDLLAIYNDVILTTTAVYQYETHSLDMRREWFAAKRQAGYPVFVAEQDKIILGFSTVGPFRAWQAYKYTVENSVYVAAGHRGKGIGKLLLAPLIDFARSRDMHAIIAGVDATNATSLRLHASFGFQEVAHFREVGYKFGRWLDLKFLELLLDTPARPVDG
ncbi:MAG: N-acetyltransferase family protein [Bacteroidota bacterium]|nr:N-acetyltransferase family protein [Bacteroidota bacterium]MDP4217641.1 N-acetyltransferase family protein [Bacteroidota bacterium]MDP4245559.1 N-acetyltransferase family protein [Bacteroidota bacterium]MDP4255925.1 N-acetyltransferase family protein [Bacteroidota bacterium]MDP4257328.1 N-acetyltransferase family protein [Bacteroidota bacterium]